jgi:hypothetical protein
LVTGIRIEVAFRAALLFRAAGQNVGSGRRVEMAQRIGVRNEAIGWDRRQFREVHHDWTLRLPRAAVKPPNPR